ncbi:MAG: hypothetical protein K2N77_11760, partial [Lachnospiraceae bacterium]|nr:hypothetical protein [Lachnospiraceae bacterium]
CSAAWHGLRRLWFIMRRVYACIFCKKVVTLQQEHKENVFCKADRYMPTEEFLVQRGTVAFV